MSSMSSNTMFQFSFIFFFLLEFTASSKDGFIFNGFNNANLNLDGIGKITSDGLIQLTNTTGHMKGHAFYPTPLQFKSSPASGKAFSFSTTFAFGIVFGSQSHLSYLGGNGITFFISPTNDLSNALESQFLGLFNSTNNGNSTNHIFAIELDTILNPEFNDVNDNHVGIDVNGLVSVNSTPAGYYEDNTSLFKNLTLISGLPMQVWIDFNGTSMQLEVTLSPLKMPKPSRPLLSSTVNLSCVLNDSMYVGFSSSTGACRASHYILGWSFKMNGVAEPLDYSKLPLLPVIKTKGSSDVLAIWLPIVTSFSVLLIIVVAVMLILRKKYSELLEDWELEYGPHRFSYKDLFRATEGFKEKHLLGSGGFGGVYRGMMPDKKREVAVKRVSHESRQGMKEFIAEIVSIGQLCHRNLVQLLGYCRRKGELMLVYDYMPNGSLDRFLYDRTKPTLNWDQRFRIIKGVASGLLYLHEDWEQVVIHRDIKASNVLLDSELNGRLGDFGLARLYDHGNDPQTTHVVGTIGYLAPELARTGRGTKATDVFAFGAFLLEVVCGRRPVEPLAEEEELILMDWVLTSWQRGMVLQTRDSRFGEEFSCHEVELVLKLGLLCLNPMSVSRPSMRQVVHYLEGDADLPELPHSYLSIRSLSPIENVGFDSYIKSLSGLSSIYGSQCEFCEQKF